MPRLGTVAAALCCPGVSPTWRLRRRQRTLNSDEKERVSSGHRLPHRTHGAVLARLSDRYARRPHTRRVTAYHGGGGTKDRLAARAAGDVKRTTKY